jgi:hypothetical protein
MNASLIGKYILFSPPYLRAEYLIIIADKKRNPIYQPLPFRKLDSTTCIDYLPAKTRATLSSASSLRVVVVTLAYNREPSQKSNGQSK